MGVPPGRLRRGMPPVSLGSGRGREGGNRTRKIQFRRGWNPFYAGSVESRSAQGGRSQKGGELKIKTRSASPYACKQRKPEIGTAIVQIGKKAKRSPCKGKFGKEGRVGEKLDQTIGAKKRTLKAGTDALNRVFLGTWVGQSPAGTEGVKSRWNLRQGFSSKGVMVSKEGGPKSRNHKI